jgi:hypothetical protein
MASWAKRLRSRKMRSNLALNRTRVHRPSFGGLGTRQLT